MSELRESTGETGRGTSTYLWWVKRQEIRLMECREERERDYGIPFRNVRLQSQVSHISIRCCNERIQSVRAVWWRGTVDYRLLEVKRDTVDDNNRLDCRRSHRILLTTIRQQSTWERQTRSYRELFRISSEMILWSIEEDWRKWRVEKKEFEHREMMSEWSIVSWLITMIEEERSMISLPCRS